MKSGQTGLEKRNALRVFIIAFVLCLVLFTVSTEAAQGGTSGESFAAVEKTVSDLGISESRFEEPVSGLGKPVSDMGKPVSDMGKPISDVGNPVSGANKESMIRFHVVANSDSEADQELKRAIRDAILEKVSPRLGQSTSLEESRSLLKSMLPEMEETAKGVVEAWSQTYPVRVAYGTAVFPTKSYGSLILPAGEYEAVRILIGEAVGSNWWCVLFPPLCFVDIDQATAQPVDGKAGIPIKHSVSAKPKVRFWLWDKLRQIFSWA